MSDELPPEDNIEQQIQTASKKLNLKVDFLREITPQEIQYLLDRCPFLQIVGPEMALEPVPVTIVQSESGWDIHDYGDAMSSSPGKLFIGGGNFRIYLEGEEEEGGGGDIINPGKGTIVNQAFVTASEMITMAQQRGWGSVVIVDGHDIMKRAAWIKASDYGIAVEGFEPTAEDERIRQRVSESGDDLKSRQKAIRPAQK